jgi:glycosyltransferase involved in cell wall biosynthesis
MSQSKPSISVVITCYAEGKLIFDAVKSVLEQTTPAKEIIVVNDASTHLETIETCQKLEQHSQIKLIWREQNGGTSAARNDGFSAATGDIIALLDADDLLPDRALAAIEKTFVDHPDAGFIYGRYLRQDEAEVEGEVIDPGEVSLQQMLKSKGLSLSSQWKLLGTTPLRRSLWESIGGYDLSFGNADLHDVEFWIRAIATGCSYYYVPETIYIWRKYFGSNSRRVTPLAWYRVAKRHLEVYRQIGLEYRAYELLLLGSKWLNERQEIRIYTKALMGCMQRGKFQLSSFIALGIPTSLLQFLANRMRKKR